nr:MAG TPA: hypothetical protein [Bacteriophage sp.]
MQAITVATTCTNSHNTLRMLYVSIFHDNKLFFSSQSYTLLLN